MYVRPRPRFRPRNAGSGNTPSLALEFNQLSALPSYVTFSRGTQAMQYGSDGTLQYAPNNLITYSRAFDNAAWTKSNSFVQTNLLLQSNDFQTSWTPTNITRTLASAIGPDGITQNAVKLEATSAAATNLSQSVIVSATSVTFSVYAKQGTGVSVGNTFGVRNNTTSTNLVFGTLNYSTGVFTYTLGSTGVVVTAAGNGYWRVQITVATGITVGDSLNVYVGYSGGVQSAGDFLYAYGAQLVQGSVPGDYVATTTAAVAVGYPSWDGTLNAKKLCEDVANTQHRTFLTAVSNAGTYTYSVYLKAGERTFAQVTHLAVSPQPSVIVNLTTGALTSATNVLSSSSTSVGNGWWRVVITYATTTTTTAYAQVGIYSNVTTGTYTGDGSSGIYIVDAQVAAGYLAGNIIPTSGSAFYGPRFDYNPSSLVTQNLLTYSEQFDNVAWGKTLITVTANADTAPDGTLTADRIVSSGGVYPQISQSPTLSAGDYTFSVWVKSDGTSQIAQAILLDGTAQAFTPTSTWTRITVTKTGVAAGSRGIVIATNSATAPASSFYVWGAQLNRGSTALPYTATTTAPYTLTTARGLLIEEQRANLFLQSNDFQTSWTPTNITRTLNSTMSPEGVSNGVKIEATTGAATTLFQAAIVSATSATGSVYVKQGTSATVANTFILRNFTTATNLIGGTLNYDTGVFTYTIGSTGVVITNVGNGWWRVAITATAGITAGDSVGIYPGWGGGVATAGDFLYAYGAQLEAGAFATSYIPTVGSTATRNADSASITTLTPWFNSAAGTFVLGLDTIWSGTLAASVGAIGFDSSASKRIVYFAAGTQIASTFDGTSVVATANNVAPGPSKVASGFDATQRFIVANGGAVITGTIAAGYSTATSLNLGNYAGSFYLNGHLQTVQFYPRRLQDTQLQSITA